MIKSFDLSVSNKVIVDYIKVERPGFSWEEVKRKVEDEFYHQVIFAAFKDADYNRRVALANQLLQQFFAANPQYQQKGAKNKVVPYLDI